LKRKNEKSVVRVVIATGISSVVTQLLVIREFLVQFTGNEFVIALILFSWLILGGFGTLAARSITPRFFKATAIRLGMLSLLLAAFSVVTLLSIRYFRDFFFIHGSSVGFYPTLYYIFSITAPYSLLLGFLLPYSLYVLRVGQEAFPSYRIYISDNFGDVTGGALFSFVLVYLVTPMQAVCIGGLPLLIAVLPFFRADFRGKLLYFFGTVLTLSAFLAGIFFEINSLSPQQGKLVHYQESRYGRIEVVRDEELFTLFSDGIPVYSNENLVMAEEVAHYPLSQLQSVQNVLVISTTGGLMTEIEKYKPETIDYVELDPEVSDVLFRFNLIKKVPGLSVINQDGRAYLMHTDKIYDAIILNLPEPETFQINRFFTDRFFALVRNHLTPQGIFSFSMEGYDNYLPEPQRQKLSSLFNTASDYFKHILLLPGQEIFFLCSDSPISRDIPALLSAKGISTEYVSRFFHGNLTPWRIDELNGLIDPNTPKNVDNSPRLMRLMFFQWFAKFSTSPVWFFVITAIILIGYLVRLHIEEYVLFSTGCMTMGCEIMIIFAFQIYFGYIYHQIGLIITVFLAGLLPGAWLGEKLRLHAGKVLLFTDSSLICMMIAFVAALSFAGDKLPVVFYIITGFATSVACGCQFPVALHLRRDDNPSVARAFSADLVGAAFGTLVTSVVLIPLAGITGAAAGLIAIKIISLLLVRISHEKN
jgi:spermidine synthase